MPKLHSENSASAVVLLLSLAAASCVASADATPFHGANKVDNTASAADADAATQASQEAKSDVVDNSAPATPDDTKGDSAAATPADANGNSGAQAPTDAAQTPAPDDSPRADATYEVPVESSLASFASYPVSHVKWEVKKGVRVLEYNLPDDLAGASNKVELSGPDTGNAWELTGQAGTASCSADADQIRCHESLPGITVDVAAIEMRVSLGQLAQEKLAVTKVFQGDPLGVLQFTPR